MILYCFTSSLLQAFKMITFIYFKHLLFFEYFQFEMTNFLRVILFIYKILFSTLNVDIRYNQQRYCLVSIYWYDIIIIMNIYYVCLYMCTSI